MKTPAEIRLERKVRIEILRMRAAVEREELRQLGCGLLEQARPKYWLSHLFGAGLGSLPALRWGRFLLSWQQRYALLLSSAWLLLNGVRKKNLRWPTLALLGLRLLRFGVQERSARIRRNPEGLDAERDSGHWTLAHDQEAVATSAYAAAPGQSVPAQSASGATAQTSQSPVSGSTALPEQVPVPGPGTGTAHVTPVPAQPNRVDKAPRPKRWRLGRQRR